MISLGPIRILMGAPPEERLPNPNSLRRAADDSKRAVIVAADLLGSQAEVGRVGLYVAAQHGPQEYCAEFIESSYKAGPRLASPMRFSEAVANIAATHLSLTLKLTGVVETFIGTRAAGIQAVMAARDDVDSGAVDTGLVVVLAVSGADLGDAYRAVHGKTPVFRNGAAALLVRRGDGPARLAFADVCCFGRRPEDQRAAVARLWESCPRKPERTLSSKLTLVDESFALDPFLQLAADSKAYPGAASRGVLCESEEGVAGLLVLDGPLAG